MNISNTGWPPVSTDIPPWLLVWISNTLPVLE
jgi:hypothetical protein